MGPLDVLKDVVARLEDARVEYFLVGSLASMYYGQLRFTNDIDLVVLIGPAKINEFCQVFPLQDYYCPPIEILRDEVLRSGSFNLIHQGSQIKIDMDIVKQTEFYESEMRRRRKVLLVPGLEAFIASPEDVIIKKLDFYRMGGSEKHLQDIRGMLAETKIDQTYLDLWIKKMGLAEQWGKVSS